MVSKIQHEANERVAIILDSPCGEKIQVTEFLQCIASKITGSCCKQENLAFIKLHRGYSGANMNEWVHSCPTLLLLV
jgi:hypothetical protein